MPDCVTFMMSAPATSTRASAGGPIGPLARVLDPDLPPDRPTRRQHVTLSTRTASAVPGHMRDRLRYPLPDIEMRRVRGVTGATAPTIMAAESGIDLKGPDSRVRAANGPSRLVRSRLTSSWARHDQPWDSHPAPGTTSRSWQKPAVQCEEEPAGLGHRPLAFAQAARRWKYFLVVARSMKVRLWP